MRGSPAAPARRSFGMTAAAGRGRRTYDETNSPRRKVRPAARRFPRRIAAGWLGRPLPPRRIDPAAKQGALRLVRMLRFACDAILADAPAPGSGLERLGHAAA